jgi:hypothetical protein
MDPLGRFPAKYEMGTTIEEAMDIGGPVSLSFKLE